MQGLDPRQVADARNCIIEKGSRERVALGVVDELLVQRLRRALRHSPLNLALHQHRVQDRAAVVDRDVPYELRLARLDVDLRHRDVAAERKRLVRLQEILLGHQHA